MDGGGRQQSPILLTTPIAFSPQIASAFAFSSRVSGPLTTPPRRIFFAPYHCVRPGLTIFPDRDHFPSCLLSSPVTTLTVTSRCIVPPLTCNLLAPQPHLLTPQPHPLRLE